MQRWMIMAALRVVAILLVAFLIGIGLGHTALFSGAPVEPVTVPVTYHM